MAHNGRWNRNMVGGSLRLFCKKSVRRGNEESETDSMIRTNTRFPDSAGRGVLGDGIAAARHRILLRVRQGFVRRGARPGHA